LVRLETTGNKKRNELNGITHLPSGEKAPGYAHKKGFLKPTTRTTDSINYSHRAVASEPGGLTEFGGEGEKNSVSRKWVLWDASNGEVSNDRKKGKVLMGGAPVRVPPQYPVHRKSHFKP